MDWQVLDVGKLENPRWRSSSSILHFKSSAFASRCPELTQQHPFEMELCTSIAQAISNLPKISTTSSASRLRSKPSLTLSSAVHHRQRRLHSCIPNLRYSTYGGANPYVAAAAAAERGTPPAYTENEATEVPEEESPANELVNEFFNNLNIKFDSEDTHSILLYGGGALVAMSSASAIVGAIDCIPLFPKLMEVVGLGYTYWFTTRYLLFKKDREELASKVEELKQQILGSNDD